MVDYPWMMKSPAQRDGPETESDGLVPAAQYLGILCMYVCMHVSLCNMYVFDLPLSIPQFSVAIQPVPPAPEGCPGGLS